MFRRRKTLPLPVFLVSLLAGCGTEDQPMAPPNQPQFAVNSALQGPTSTVADIMVKYTSSTYARIEADPGDCFLITDNWQTGAPYTLEGKWTKWCSAGSAVSPSYYQAKVRAYDSSGAVRATLNVTVGKVPPPPVKLAGPTTIQADGNITQDDVVRYWSEVYPTIEADPATCLYVAEQGTRVLEGAWIPADFGVCGFALGGTPNPYTATVVAKDAGGVVRASLQVKIYWN